MDKSSLADAQKRANTQHSPHGGDCHWSHHAVPSKTFIHFHITSSWGQVNGHHPHYSKLSCPDPKGIRGPGSFLGGSAGVHVGDSVCACEWGSTKGRGKDIFIFSSKCFYFLMCARGGGMQRVSEGIEEDEALGFSNLLSCLSWNKESKVSGKVCWLQSIILLGSGVIKTLLTLKIKHKCACIITFKYETLYHSCFRRSTK